MRICLLLIALILLIRPTEAGWQDLMAKFHQVKDGLFGSNSINSNPQQPLRAERANLESAQQMDAEKLRAGLRELKRRANERLAKENRFADKVQVDRKVMERIEKLAAERVAQRGLKGPEDEIWEINLEYDDNDLLYQGDIILTERQLDELLQDDTDVDQGLDHENRSRQKRQAMAQGVGLWPNNKVFYYFDASIQDQAKPAILAAIEFWQKNTCVDFEESSTAKDRIKIYAGDGCHSNIGWLGGERELSIGIKCKPVGTAIHELGHALGFWHEQARHDRDDYITVNLANVKPNHTHNFNKQPASDNDNYGMPYEWGSVMQYGERGFSSNELPTIIAKDPHYQETMGTRIAAFYDVSMMNERYGCKARCPADTSAHCYNGGFPHPRNCSVCYCPRGFGGPRCADLDPLGDCGDYLKATSTPQKLDASVNQDNEGLFRNECSYIIYADEGMQIEATIGSLYDAECEPGCNRRGLELKAAPDLKRSGYSYCCKADEGTVVTSAFNALPLTYWSRAYHFGFTLGYRAVPSTSTPQEEAPRLTILNNLDEGQSTTESYF